MVVRKGRTGQHGIYEHTQSRRFAAAGAAIQAERKLFPAEDSYFCN
jgi:hypothetical protein